MNLLTILNDVHAGTIRNTGVTPSSQYELRVSITEQFRDLLPEKGDLMILGDLFNGPNIPILDLLKTHEILADWLAKTGRRLILVAGNHDLSKTSTTLSSFHFLASLLKRAFAEQVQVITQPEMTDYGYVIPHLANQDLFNEALDAVPECDYLFLHCNYNNGFAAQSDQSLNLSKDQLLKLPIKCAVFAHEHNTRVLRESNGIDAVGVIIPGNQIATSIADWQNTEAKSFAVIEDNRLSLKRCKLRDEDYIEMPWNDLRKTDHKFVKLVGKVDASLEADTITALNKLRQMHNAFVVSYGVNVVREDTLAAFNAAAKVSKSFDIWEVLKEFLTEAEYKTVINL